jgi:hypothetical protein
VERSGLNEFQKKPTGGIFEWKEKIRSSVQLGFILFPICRALTTGRSSLMRIVWRHVWRLDGRQVAEALQLVLSTSLRVLIINALPPWPSSSLTFNPFSMASHLIFELDAVEPGRPRENV